MVAVAFSALWQASVALSTGNEGLHGSVYLTETALQEQWQRELSAWRTLVGEHGRLLQGWRKAWVRGWDPRAVLDFQGISMPVALDKAGKLGRGALTVCAGGLLVFGSWSLKV